MPDFKMLVEEIRVFAHELPGKIRELIHEGNVRRVIIKDEQGHTFMEIPVTVAAVGAVLAPVLAAVGALAATAARFTIVLEKTDERGPARAVLPPAGIKFRQLLRFEVHSCVSGRPGARVSQSGG